MLMRGCRAALVAAVALVVAACGAPGAAGVGDTAAAPGVQAGGAGGRLKTLGAMPGQEPLTVTDLRFEAKNLPQAGAARP